jgi:cytoskeletal protein CcmA (bactofilin family)
MQPDRPPVHRDRRGIALPFALIGLVAISILVTTVLLTSSSEFAISNAHRDAAASLYRSEATLEQFVVANIVGGGELSLLQFANGTSPQPTFASPDGTPHNVQVSIVSSLEDVTAVPMVGQEVFSVLVQPANGRGRGVGAFVNTIRSFTPINLSANINAGATIGGNVRVSGNAVISDGNSAVNYCDAEHNQADFAVQVSAGSDVDYGNDKKGRIDGEIDIAEWEKEDMQKVLLGADSALHRLAHSASIQFGPAFDKPAWKDRDVQRANGGNTGAGGSISIPMNWGCPQELLERTTCPDNGSKDRLVMVAIDASSEQGRTVVLNGDHGQGMIIVINGHLRIQGNFVFKGIILVEDDIHIYGGGGGEESKVEGAVIAFGSASDIEDNVSGTATVKYNLCAILDAQGALNTDGFRNAPRILSGTTYAWHEIIR